MLFLAHHPSHLSGPHDLGHRKRRLDGERLPARQAGLGVAGVAGHPDRLAVSRRAALPRPRRRSAPTSPPSGRRSPPPRERRSSPIRWSAAAGRAARSALRRCSLISRAITEAPRDRSVALGDRGDGEGDGHPASVLSQALRLIVIDVAALEHPAGGCPAPRRRDRWGSGWTPADRSPPPRSSRTAWWRRGSSS